MKDEAERLLKKGVFLFSVFLVIFILSHVVVSMEDVTVSSHLRIHVSGPASTDIFVRDYNRWKTNEVGYTCPDPCISCARLKP